MNQLRETVDQKLQHNQDESATKLAQVREELAKTLKDYNATLASSIGGLGQLQKTQLEAVSAQLDKLASTTEQKLDGLQTGMTATLKSLQADHTKQLEQVRASVDEKLQGAEKRLGEAFKQVSERLNSRSS